MKNSGIEWIGEIPDNWEVSRVKNAFYLSKIKAKQENPVVLKLARDGIKEKDVSINEGQMAESYTDYNPVRVGDLLLNPMDLYSGANCNVSELEGVISPAYANLRSKTDLNSKYFDYYFKYQYWTMAMFAHGKGISFDNRWTINSETLLNYYIPYPSFDQQNKIVANLNKKLDEINSLIGNQNEQIEKLKEYKQAVITEAVTKGLDPTAPMKLSGVEWIGDIPERWEILRIKNLIAERNERSENGNEEPLSMSQKYGLIPTKMMDIVPNMASSFIGAKITHTNDIVFNKLKAHLGVFSVSMYEGLVSPDYAVYYSKGLSNLKYLEYLFKTPQCIMEFRKRSTGIAAGLTRLYTQDLFEICCPYPNIDEQNNIVLYLDKKCSEIDKLIALKQKKIEKLNEYKKSLIYEYVTGKKEVI